MNFKLYQAKKIQKPSNISLSTSSITQYKLGKVICVFAKEKSNGLVLYDTIINQLGLYGQEEKFLILIDKESLLKIMFALYNDLRQYYPEIFCEVMTALNVITIKLNSFSIDKFYLEITKE